MREGHVVSGFPRGSVKARLPLVMSVIRMKRQLLAILLTFVMLASAFAAMGISATKVAALTGTTLTVSSSDYSPAAGQSYTLSGYLHY
jgi:P pilus assembly chaperone PapD